VKGFGEIPGDEVRCDSDRAARWPPGMEDTAKIGRGQNKSGAGNIYLTEEKGHRDCAAVAPRRNLES
jgi:hypothetical protein